LEPRREAYSFAIAEEPLPWDTSLRIALWASSDADNSKAYDAIAGTIRELTAATASLDARAKAETVLEFMHRRFLRGYSDRQTRVDTIVFSGQFNCVSSAALYIVLGTAVGLDVTGVMTKDHAFCSVRIGIDFVDVETTSLYGVDPGSKKEFHDSFGRATGFAYVPPRNYRDRTPIGRKALLSLILSNRSADLESQGRYSEAVGLAADRWALLGGDGGTGREDLVARLLNYGTSLVNSGNEPAALDWALKAVSQYGEDRRWDNFTHSAANNLLVKHIRGGRIVQARAELGRLGPLLDRSAGRELDRLVTDAELVEAAEVSVRSGDPAIFTAKAASARSAAAVPHNRIREIEIFATLKYTERIAREKGWAAAYAETEQAIARIGSDRKLEEALRAYRLNRIAELHNAFARFFNSKKYAEAYDAAAAAVAEFPDEPRLRTDQDAAERALRSVGR